MKKIFSMLCCLALGSSMQAQEIGGFSLEFDSLGWQLDQSAKLEIDKEVAALANVPSALKVSVTSYTRKHGNKQVNQEVSRRRAKGIKNYLKTKGFVIGKVELDGAVAEPCVGCAIYNQVDVGIELLSVQLGEKLTLQVKPEKFVLNANQSATLVTLNGTMIYVPSNAFVNQTGQVVNGDITLEFSAFRNQIDFILAGAPFYKEQKDDIGFSNAYEMFEVKAIQNGVKLQLAPQTPLAINLQVPTGAKSMTFYQLDKTQTVWNEKYQLTDAAGKFIYNQPKIEHFNANAFADYQGMMSWGTSMFQSKPATNCQKTCNIQPRSQCDWFVSMVDFGFKYAKSNKKLTQVFPNATNSETALVRLKSEEKKLLTLLDEVDVRLNKITYQYEIVSFEKRGKTIEFKFTTARENKKWNDFKGVFWYVPKISKTDLATFREKDWTHVEVFENEPEKFTMLVSNDTESLRFPVSPKAIPGKNSKKNRLKSDLYHTIYKKYDAKLKEELRAKEALLVEKQQDQDILTNVRQEMADLRSKRTSQIADSLICFWNFNRQFVESEQEASLCFEDWAHYFDTTENKMDDRYTYLIASKKYAHCLIEIAKYDSIEAEGGAEAVNQYISQQQSAVKASVSARAQQFIPVYQLGKYKATNYQTVEKPVTIAPNYVDQDGKQLKATRVYVVDDRLNGIREFNGFKGYGPKFFPIDEGANSALLIMTGNGLLYKINARAFKLSLATQPEVGELGELKPELQMEALRVLKNRDPLVELLQN